LIVDDDAGAADALASIPQSARYGDARVACYRRDCSCSEHPGRELVRAAGIGRYLIKPVSSADVDELFT
jgi:hypothetical protein